MACNIAQRLSRLGIAGIVAVTFLSGAASAEGTMAPQELVKALQKGGYVVYMRHTATDKATKDLNHDDLSSCDTQRLLSDKGREDAKAIGAAMEKLGIGTGTVYASPYCRATEAAELAFGAFETSETLRYLTPMTKEQKATASAALREMISTAPAAGANTVLVSHNSNLKEGTGAWPKNAGVAFVYKPLGNGEFEELGKIEVEEWPALVAGN